MPKRIRDYPIYLAPKIRGVFNNGVPEVIDEKNNELINSNSIDGKITIYERQVNAWFLERASRLTNGENNGFVVLMICISYIEGVQQYMNGQAVKVELSLGRV